jgi:hypothetical protein
MPITKISEYSATAASNTDINGIDIAEGCAPSGINDAIRTLMKQIKDLQAGTSGDTIPLTAGGTGATTAAAARTALGLAIGTNVQAYDQNLTTFVNVFTLPTADGTANQVLKTDGSGVLGFAAGATGDVTTTGTQTLTNKTISGADNTLSVDGTVAVGFRTIPQNSQSAAYTLVLADSGKQIFHPSADTTARTFTIPANGTVAFPIGAAVTFINQNGAGVVTIAITTDTMRLAGAGTTGSRTLAANGIATAIKVTSTEWIISGTGLT